MPLHLVNRAVDFFDIVHVSPSSFLFNIPHVHIYTSVIMIYVYHSPSVSPRKGKLALLCVSTWWMVTSLLALL